MALTQNEKIARLLDAAAERIESHGWIRGEYGNEEVGYCTLGALTAAINDVKGVGRATMFPAQVALQNDIDKTSGGQHYSIVGWNDSRNARKDRVVRKLRKVARNLREQ